MVEAPDLQQGWEKEGLDPRAWGEAHRNLLEESFATSWIQQMASSQSVVSFRDAKRENSWLVEMFHQRRRLFHERLPIRPLTWMSELQQGASKHKQTSCF